MKFLTLDCKYIAIVNKCDMTEMYQFFLEIIKIPEVFERKRYIWNIIRGKDFYKCAADFVVREMAQLDMGDPDELSSDHITNMENMINGILNSTKNEAIRKSFVWNVTKKVPILYMVMLPYMSPERIQNILKSDNLLIDDALKPIIDIIKDQRHMIEDLQSMNNTFQNVSLI